uniref:Uncharacterized protein n=1 Tax=Podospora anserina (strain S / ATCC MYA-4624 / DSM 980 / FGSC 10383) TaxID=515849 RepID=A0A090CTM8_PODAN|nr:Putative protein of unknown function [Podospora anserina S mat+]
MAWRKEDSKPGQCWHSLFGNPIVVEGYPMSQRPKGNTGIEIPLHMAAAFIAALRLHRFLGHYYLKGFSAILIAVEVVGNVVLWHHWYNPTGERISYLDAATAEGKIEISLEDLRSRRHVGWCSEALCMAGDKSAKYQIGSSRLPCPSREFSLEKVSFSVGQTVTGGCQFSIGKKYVPLHITKQGYIAKLRRIDQKYVVMWDEEDKRGWLVKGTRALLHLVRASLEHCRDDKFSSEFLYDFNAFEEPNTRF